MQPDARVNLVAFPGTTAFREDQPHPYIPRSISRENTLQLSREAFFDGAPQRPRAITPEPVLQSLRESSNDIPRVSAERKLKRNKGF